MQLWRIRTYLRRSLLLLCPLFTSLIPQVDEQMLNVQNKNSSYFVESCLYYPFFGRYWVIGLETFEFFGRVGVSENVA